MLDIYDREEWCWCRSSLWVFQMKRRKMEMPTEDERQPNVNFPYFMCVCVCGCMCGSAFSIFTSPLFILFWTKRSERICDKLQFDLLLWWSFEFKSHSCIVFKTVFQSIWHVFSLRTCNGNASKQLQRKIQKNTGNIWITVIIQVSCNIWNPSFDGRLSSNARPTTD